jgi:hypothetical protein
MIVLKEIGIILGEIGCVFLLLCLFGFMYPFEDFAETLAQLALLVFAVVSFLLCVLLVYSALHIKKL